MELAAIDSICRGTRKFTSSHTTNFAALINGNLIVDCYSATISHADRRGAIGNGFDTGQIFIQIDFIIGMSIFRYCRGNSGIDPIRNSCLGCCCLFLQLAYIDCIFVSCTCCHIVNLAGFIHIHFAVNSNSSFFIQFYR